MSEKSESTKPEENDDVISEEEESGRSVKKLRNYAAAFVSDGHEEGPESGAEQSGDTEPDNKETKLAKKPDKKKRNRKKKKAAKTEDHDDMLDKIISEMNAMTTTTSTSTEQKCHKDSVTIEELLKIDNRCLDPDAELRRLLGRTFGEKQPKGPRHQHQRMGLAGRLVKAQANWPPPRQIGIYMVSDTDKMKDDKAHCWFRFRHNEIYQNQQQMFWLYQRQMDHEAILNDLLVQNPYHLDSLLLLSEILNVQEDFQGARTAIERAIFACESVFHSTFQPLSPLHRLDYAWRENRALFLLLHRHMLHQLKRRCFQTAFNFGKLIFAKDPDGDPLGLLLLIDTLALKARSPDFLLAFYAHFCKQRRLDMMPNFLFSLPLAHLALADDAKLKDVHEKEAEKSLEEALVRFPFLLTQLLDRLSIQPDSTIQNNTYMNALAFYSEPIGSRLLAHIYAFHSAEELWRLRLEWLEQATHRILPKLANRRTEMDEWALKRKSCFVGMPANVIRHCILHQIRPSDSSLSQQFDDQSGPDIVTDPCPMRETKADYAPANLNELLELHGVNQNPETSDEQQMTGAGGVIGTFLRTLLPEQEQNRLSSILQSVRRRIEHGDGPNTSAVDGEQQNAHENRENERDDPDHPNQ